MNQIILYNGLEFDFRSLKDDEDMENCDEDQGEESDNETELIHKMRKLIYSKADIIRERYRLFDEIGNDFIKFQVEPTSIFS